MAEKCFTFITCSFAHCRACGGGEGAGGRGKGETFSFFFFLKTRSVFS